MANNRNKNNPRVVYVDPPRKNRGLHALIYVLVVVGVSFVLAVVGWKCACDMFSLDKDGTEVQLTITQDMITTKEVTADDGTVSEEEYADMSEVADLLKDNGLIRYKSLFLLFSQFSHASEKITPGTYQLNSDMDYSALVNNLSSNSDSRATIDLMIPEGLTLEETFQLLEDNGVANVDDLEETAATHDYAFDWLEDIPLGDASRLEGYLFPDTYTFYLGEDPLYVINKMLVNFDEKLTEDMRTQIADSGYTIHDIVILASIIEKETDGSDQADIASVLYNRLETDATGGYLQMDSTIQYLLDERKETLTEEDLAIDSPYNTYLYPGLPAGPISNPGMEAIYAAINPNDTDYVYFLTGADGTTQFFSSYDEFAAARDALAAESDAG